MLKISVFYLHISEYAVACMRKTDDDFSESQNIEQVIKTDKKLSCE